MRLTVSTEFQSCVHIYIYIYSLQGFPELQRNTEQREPRYTIQLNVISGQEQKYNKFIKEELIGSRY